MLLLLLSLVADPSGLSLLRLCNGEPGSVPHTACVMYVSGYIEGMAAAQEAQRSLGRPAVCINSDLSSEDLRRVTREGLQRNLARQKAPMGAALTGVLVEAYPCKR